MFFQPLCKHYWKVARNKGINNTLFSDCQTGKQPCRQECNLQQNFAPCLPVSNYGRRRTKTRRGFLEQFYASTEEKESVARPSVHSQTTLVQGQRRESSPAIPESSVSVKGKGLPADRLVVIKLESTTDSGHTDVFHLKIILLIPPKKNPVSAQG